MAHSSLAAVWGPNPRPSFQRVVPPAALLAYSRPSDLASRFSNEELANSIARDNVQDDDDLASSIEAGLETRWWGACKETGESEALRIADAKAEETQRLKAFADNIMEPGFKAIHQDTIGHINKFGPVEDEMNGYEEYEEYEDEGEYEDEQEYEGEDDVVHGVEGDDEYEEGENGMDEDGDVEMEG